MSFFMSPFIVVSRLQNIITFVICLLQAHKRGGISAGPAEQRAAGTVQAASFQQRPKAESACVPVSNPSAFHCTLSPLSS